MPRQSKEIKEIIEKNKATFDKCFSFKQWAKMFLTVKVGTTASKTDDGDTKVVNAVKYRVSPERLEKYEKAFNDYKKGDDDEETS